MLGQLEQAQHSDDVQELDGIASVHPNGGQGPVGVEGQGGHQIHHVDRVLHEKGPIGAGQQTDQELQGEPEVADQFHVEELVVGSGKDQRSQLKHLSMTNQGPTECYAW